ncbi:MAG TPA: glycosyltransferase, partial [Candidatus Paceibacterota bacterium]|nr:glycosyltransferase [Candidatus Paceibacterota bacterium]
MRILFYSDNFYPEISGISDSIITLGRELIRRGHTVGFAVPKYSDADYRYAGLDPDDSKFLEGFEVYRIPSLCYGNSPSGQARMVVPLGWSLGFVRKFKPDIIHSQSPFGTGFEALFAAKLFNIPLIGTNHTIMSEFARIYGPKYLEHTADKFLFWYYRRCLATSVPSPSLAEKMSATGYKGTLEVIPNPVSLAQFSPASPAEREALRKEFHLLGPTILFVGRLGKEKQIEPIIDAMVRLEHVPFIKLVIAGSGPLEADLKKKVRDLNIPEKVVFTGFLDH